MNPFLITGGPYPRLALERVNARASSQTSRENNFRKAVIGSVLGLSRKGRLFSATFFPTIFSSGEGLLPADGFALFREGAEQVWACEKGFQNTSV